jgi:flagellar L-ring protein precursor FlgH
MKQRWIVRSLVLVLVIANAAPGEASTRSSQDNSLARYLARVETAEPSAAERTLGSCWVDSGRLASLSADYKAATIGDLITIVVVQDVKTSNTGNVSTGRTFSASSGVDSLPGKIKVGGAANLLGLHSAETLAGKGQASSTLSVTTTLAGRVVAVLPSGNLVVQAERMINMNNEKQTIVMRGVVRRGDIGPNNTVASNTVSDLELEIKGKGVISDGVRPPHPLLRLLLRVFNF